MIRPILKRRSGFTLIELLVVIAIIAVLIGLTVPAVQKVRAMSNRIKSQNHLKNLALAAVNAHENRKKLPPSMGDYGGKLGQTAFYHLLPYLEEESIYVDPVPHKFKVGTFISPADNTALDGLIPIAGVNFGASSYAYNDLCSQLRMPDNFLDGTSKTILFTEKVALCNGTVNGVAVSGGNAWGLPLALSTAFPAAPPPTTPTTFYHPFIMTATLDQNTPAPALVFRYLIHTGATLGPPSNFNAEPQFRTQIQGCNPFTASTVNADIINVAFADGSARSIANNIVGASSNTTPFHRLSATSLPPNYSIWYTMLTPINQDNKGEDLEF